MSAPFWRLQSGGRLFQQIYLNTPGDFEAPSHWYLGTHPIEADYRPLTVRCGREFRAYPDYFTHGMLDIVSDRFRHVLLELNAINVEFLPVTVLGKMGEHVASNPYWYLRSLETVNCVNAAESNIEFWNEETHLVKTISRLILSESAIGNRTLFQPLGMNMLFVSSETKKRIEQDSLLIHVLPLEDVRLGIHA